MLLLSKRSLLVFTAAFVPVAVLLAAIVFVDAALVVFVVVFWWVGVLR